MSFCHACATELKPSAKFCGKCGAATLLIDTPDQQFAVTSYSSEDWKAVSKPTVFHTVHGFNPAFAFLLSLVLPGLGHIYRGKIGKGIGWFVFAVLADLIFGFLTTVMPPCVVVVILVHFWCAATAMKKD